MWRTNIDRDFEASCFFDGNFLPTAISRKGTQQDEVRSVDVCKAECWGVKRDKIDKITHSTC